MTTMDSKEQQNQQKTNQAGKGSATNPDRQVDKKLDGPNRPSV